MSKQAFTIIETTPKGERVKHGIYYDLGACTTELERLCFSGKYPDSKWSFITNPEEFGNETAKVFYTQNGVQKEKVIELPLDCTGDHTATVDHIDKIMGGNDKWDGYEIIEE